MVTHQLHIVGLPYGDVGDCMDEFLGQAVGKVVTLRPQPTNEVDAHAIRAYDWIGRHVGYVAKAELPTAWNILRSRGSHSVRGRAAEVDCEHHCVVVECVAEVKEKPDELYSQTDFLSWHYDGPVMPQTEELDYRGRVHRVLYREITREAFLTRVEEDRRADTDHCVRDLLQDLRDGRLQHGLVGLEITAQDAQYAEQEHCRGKDLQHRYAVGRHQCSRAKIQKKAPRYTYGKRVYHRAVEHLLRVLVVSHRHFLCHLLGDRRWHAETRDHQHDRIDIDRRPVVAIALVTDDRRQRRPVQKAYDPGQNTGSRQYSRLCHYIAASAEGGAIARRSSPTCRSSLARPGRSFPVFL